MKKWQVLLKGHRYDLESLKNIIQDNQDFSIVKDGDDYYIESVKFKGLEDSIIVADKAIEILRLPNGLAKLVVTDYKTVKLGLVTELDDQLNRNSYIHPPFINSIARAYPPTVIQEGRDKTYLKEEINFKVISGNTDLSEAVSIYSHEDLSWSDLYKIYEIIKNSGSNKELLRTCNISKKDISRFTQTSQNPDLIGEEARHARFAGEKPKHPMIYDEAYKLISALLRKWIELLG